MKVAFSGPVRLDESQIEPAARTLARAFYNYPVFTYVFPDASEREKELPLLFQSFIHYGIVNGEVYGTSPELEGVTVWLPPGYSGGYLTPPEVSKDALDRMTYWGRQVYPIRKRIVPDEHWFLELIGIVPEFQGKGYAGVLLLPMLAKIAHQHLPCYLDTELEKNVTLYQHFGFRVAEDMDVPGTGVHSWGMIINASSPEE